MVELLHGDCLERLRELPDCSVDACVTDPPYGLRFMGKAWDYDVPQAEVWREVLRVLKPGGHLLAFAGTRTQHRMAVQIEDAGFEIRDLIAWVYGSGFPKSLDVSKAIDKRGGASVSWFGPWFREWRKQNGVTQKEVAALFPSKTGGLTGCVANWELGFNMPTPDQFNLIRDTFGLPFESIAEAEREVVAQQRGTQLAVAPGQGNDRSATTLDITTPSTPEAQQWAGWGTALKPALEPITVARKPLSGTVAENVLRHGTGALNVDGCRVAHTEECRMMAPSQANIANPSDKCRQAGRREAVLELKPEGRWPANLIHDGSEEPCELLGSAARFFYCAKASKADRGAENVHPTVKPTELMRYLVRLVTPPGGLVLDPFMGSGSTGKAAVLEGFRFIGIEREAEYIEIARGRIQVPEQVQEDLF
jgi:DNA modification methylase/transcriptional regulator with XRE-family HTH domain